MSIYIDIVVHKKWQLTYVSKFGKP